MPRRPPPPPSTPLCITGGNHPAQQGPAEVASCPATALVHLVCACVLGGGAAQSFAVPVLGSWKRVPKGTLPAGDLGWGQWLESGVCMRVKNQNQQPGWQSCVSGAVLRLWRS